MRLEERLKGELAALERAGRLRMLQRRSGLDLSSNDTLGLSSHPALRARVAVALAAGLPVGAGGSRLLAGNHAAHEEVEEELARFIGARDGTPVAALLFVSGYAANMAVLSALPARDDIVFLDERSHASLREGARASLAETVRFRHGDLDSLEGLLKSRRGRAQQAFVVVESLGGMDGDLAPLDQLVRLASAHDACLVVDEAHATGVLGPTGRGALEGVDLGGVPVVSVHTGGKALGVCGAFVVCRPVVKRYLVNRARTFLFSTAPSPLVAEALRAALEVVDAEPWRRERVLSLASRLRARLAGLETWRLAGGGSHIVPVVIGEDRAALCVSAALEQEGFDVGAVRTPTVPAGTARLRISVNVHLEEDDADRLAGTLLRIERDVASEANAALLGATSGRRG